MPENNSYESLIDRLVDAGVLVTDPRDELRLTKEFAENRGRSHALVQDLSEAEYRAEMKRRNVGSDNFSSESINRQVLADAMAIEEHSSIEQSSDSLIAARALSRIIPVATDTAPSNDIDQVGENRDGGVPDGFVPLSPDEITSTVEQNEAAILYCWREDCDPCDVMKRRFETLVAEGGVPRDIPLGAVYGPATPDLLSERYDVSVAPTTLFCLNGRVDSRIVGSANSVALRDEVDILVEKLDK